MATIMVLVNRLRCSAAESLKYYRTSALQQQHVNRIEGSSFEDTLLTHNRSYTGHASRRLRVCAVKSGGRAAG